MKEKTRKQIEDLGKKFIQDMIKAMQVTHDGYKDRNSSWSCMFCYNAPTCFGCPWTIMTDIKCYDSGNYPFSKWRTLRMRQLKSWIKDWREVLKGMK